MRLPWRKRTIDAVMVQFLDGPLEGRVLPVARKHLSAGVTWHEDGFAYGPNPQAWALRAGMYNLHQVTAVHYRFEEQDGTWAAVADDRAPSITTRWPGPPPRA